MMRGIAIVLGSGTNGSAIACGLHADGLGVVIIDRADPSCPYRGMAFSDAWFLGTCELDALSACFCASVRSIPTVLRRRMIAATTWSWRGVAEALGADVLVDTRGSDARSALRTCFPLTRTAGNDQLSGPDHADLVTRLTTRFPKRTVVAADTVRPVPARLRRASSLRNARAASRQEATSETPWPPVNKSPASDSIRLRRPRRV